MKKINSFLMLVVCIVTSFNALAKPFPQSNNFGLINHTEHKNFHAKILYKNGRVSDAVLTCVFNLNKHVCSATISNIRYEKGPIMKMAIVAGKKHGCSSPFYTYEQLELSTLVATTLPGAKGDCIFSRIKK